MNANTDFSGRVIEVDYERSTLLVRYEGEPPEVGTSFPNDDGEEASCNLIRAVFLDLLGQVDQFIEEQGEADFYTGPARALRCVMTGKTPPDHLQAALAAFLLKQAGGSAVDGVKGGRDAAA
jgi:hypothetical protein